MADKHETKLDNLVFEDEPLEYCKAAYDKAAEHNESLEQNEVIEDKAFYYGKDPDLEARRNDPTVVRAAHYVPECSTAIDTRASAVLDRAQEDNPLIRMNPPADYEEDENVIEVLDDLEDKLNDQLVKSEFLFRVYMDWFNGAELQPLSIVKVGREQKFDWVAKRKPIMQQAGVFVMALLRGRMPTMEERTEYVYELIEERPTVEWLNWDEFLYLPSATELQNLEFVIHRQYWSWSQIKAEADKDGWDKVELDRLKEGGMAHKADDAHAEKVESELGRDSREYMRDGKYLIAEFWIAGRDEEGRGITNRVVVGNNNYLLKQEVSDIPTLKYPFIIRRAWPKLGYFEGRSSVSLVKETQRLYNDAHNTLLDGCTYGIFAPLLKKREMSIYGDPKYGPARFLEVDDVDGIKALEPNIGKLELLPGIANEYAAKIRQILNAPDINQGIGDDMADQEKATKTRLRVMGSMRRLRPLFESVRQDMIAVADMFIKINQAADPNWIVPYELDVPAFSGVSSPDEERQNAILLYQIASQSPLYQNPEGQLKLRQLWLDVLSKSRIEDVDSRCVTEEELTQFIAMQMTMAADQERIENAQSATPPQNKEKKNESMAQV